MQQSLWGWVRAGAVCAIALNLASCSIFLAVGKTFESCPPTQNISDIASINFEQEFGFDAATAFQVRAGVIAATDINRLADDIDGDLKEACGGIASDLGVTTKFESGIEACEVVVAELGKAKAKIGANAKLALDIESPSCGVSMNAIAECAAACDASLKPGEVDVQCEGGELSGVCEGQCTGSCELTAAGSCGGTCSGTCESAFSGQCGGECAGTCDGETVDGLCAGNCVGVCGGEAEGTCGGQCSGSCQMEAAASCGGTCHGGCSVAFKEPSCSGTVKPPKLEGECGATCETHAAASVVCTMPAVSVSIDGAVDPEAAAKIVATLEKHLPVLVRVAVGLGPKLLEIVGNALTTIQGGFSAVKSIADNPAYGVRVMDCLPGPFTDAISAVANIQASVSLTVDVQASVAGLATTSE